MGFFNRIFGRTTFDEAAQPDIRFGRYSDSYKSSMQYDAWDRALKQFENGAYIQAYKDFFVYLRDEHEENVLVQEKDGKLEFELYQGSKKISGLATPLQIVSEAKVAKLTSKNARFLRRLLEQNFALRYSRFALDSQSTVTIKFDSFSIDGSPYKLYYALKELATHADKQDDLLLEEFHNLIPVDTDHLLPLPDAEKEAKYSFIVKEIRAVFDTIDESALDKQLYPGGVTYLLLDLSYKLDYLTNPEGYTMETLERIHRRYFSNDQKTTAEKNTILRSELQKLLDRPKTDYFNEMYRGTSTFGITTPVNHDRVVDFIDGELNNMDWYNEQGYEKIALAVPGYIVGYCLFNYAIPLPDRALFHLYFQIMEPRYFASLGFSAIYRKPDGVNLNNKAIRKAIRSIANRYQEQYPQLQPDTGLLEYGSMANFAKSYLQMIRKLDMTRQH